MIFSLNLFGHFYHCVGIHFFNRDVIITFSFFAPFFDARDRRTMKDTLKSTRIVKEEKQRKVVVCVCLRGGWVSVWVCVWVGLYLGSIS